MMHCTSCGRQLPENSKKFCPYCGAEIQFIPDGINDGMDNEKSYSTSKMPKLSDDEQIVKSYACATSRSGSCRLSVTNKRIIFHAIGNDKSYVDKEIHIDSVTGIDCMRGTNYNFAKIVFGAILGIIGLVIAAEARKIALIGLVIMGIAALIIYTSVRPSYYLTILSSKSDASPIDIGTGATSIMGNKAILQFICEPTDEAFTMINELGALILDLQTLGDYAIEKWASK